MHPTSFNDALYWLGHFVGAISTIFFIFFALSLQLLPSIHINEQIKKIMFIFNNRNMSVQLFYLREDLNVFIANYFLMINWSNIPKAEKKINNILWNFQFDNPNPRQVTFIWLCHISIPSGKGSSRNYL